MPIVFDATAHAGYSPPKHRRVGLHQVRPQEVAAFRHRRRPPTPAPAGRGPPLLLLCPYAPDPSPWTSVFGLFTFDFGLWTLDFGLPWSCNARKSLCKIVTYVFLRAQNASKGGSGMGQTPFLIAPEGVEGSNVKMGKAKSCRFLTFLIETLQEYGPVMTFFVVFCALPKHVSHFSEMRLTCVGCDTSLSVLHIRGDHLVKTLTA